MVDEREIGAGRNLSRGRDRRPEVLALATGIVAGFALVAGLGVLGGAQGQDSQATRLAELKASFVRPQFVPYPANNAPNPREIHHATVERTALRKQYYQSAAASRGSWQNSADGTPATRSPDAPLPAAGRKVRGLHALLHTARLGGGGAVQDDPGRLEQILHHMVRAAQREHQPLRLVAVID